MEEMLRKITKPNCTYNCKTSCSRKTMAASPVNPKSHQHTRSNSLPTRTHPLISEFNDQLSKLRDFEETSPSSTSICQKLNGLQDLHGCVDKLLQLPFTQPWQKNSTRNGFMRCWMDLLCSWMSVVLQ